ncbi:MAG: hypothetical protein VZQ62_00550 [Methanosphaera sp.]|nr:hypothetical protein [Methanosphaera sp.]
MEKDDIKKRIKKKNNVLLDLIKKDETLNKKENREQKMSYLSLATLFMEKFDENINKTSIEMNNSIPVGVDTWKEFLNYPVVRKYIQSFRDEKIMNVADSGLMEGNKNAVNIKKAMEDRGPVINNSNIILIRIPEKQDFE